MAKGKDQPFDEALKRYFNCTKGAYSPVTEDEAKHRQVTLTGVESDIATEFFSTEYLEKFRGSKKSLAKAGVVANISFRKFPTGEIVNPTVNYPKPLKNELRLYFKESEFSVREGDHWGVFVRGGEIWIFSVSEQIRKQVASGSLGDGTRTVTLESEEDNFQELANDAPPEQVTAILKKWDRNPALSAKAFAARGYTCELMPDGPSFISRRSGLPFNEAHHLIPMREQAQYPQTLDTLDNICVLNPFAHRRLHHANFDAIVPDLRKLIGSRPALLERHGLLEDDVIGFYR